MSHTSTAPPPPHMTNSDSTQQHKVGVAAGHRVKTGGLHLPAHQATSLPHGLKHELLYIPSSTIPNWGSYFVVDIKEKNINLNNVTLQFNMGTVTGTFTSTTAAPAVFNPATYFFTRIEIVQNGQILDTLYGNEQFLRTQFLEWDEDRAAINNSMGNYASSTQRALVSSTTTSNIVYVPLRALFDQMKLPIYTDQQYIQLRVYLDTFSNVFPVATGSAACTINSCNAICKITRLDQETALTRHNDHAISPHHTIFHDVRYYTTTIPTGTTSFTTILGSIVGNVAGLVFTLRAATTGTGAWNYYQIKDFALLDAASTNIVGGVPIPASYAANMYNKDCIKSSYNTETSFGSTDNKANVYMWSFSADLVEALSTGKAYTSKKFTGQEQLLIDFPVATSASLQLDVYAYVENIHEMSPTSVKKISL